MSSAAAYDAISGRITGAWTATPVLFENDDHEFPDTPSPFVYVEIYGDTYNQDTVGAPQENHFLEQGVAYLHVMVPNDTGSRAARVHADALMNLFREQVTGGVYIEEFSIGAGDPGRTFPNWWAMTVTMHWYRRDITDLT